MRLGRWQRSAVYAVSMMVGLSGLVWFILHDLVEEGPSELTWALLVVHGISAFAFLIVFGSLLPLHARSGWLKGRNVASGIALLAMSAVLAVTALLLYYGGEETRWPTRWMHIAVGGFCFVVIPLHVMLGRKTRKSQVSFKN